VAVAAYAIAIYVAKKGNDVNLIRQRIYKTIVTGYSSVGKNFLFNYKDLSASAGDYRSTLLNP